MTTGSPTVSQVDDVAARSPALGTVFEATWFEPWFERISQIGHPANAPGEVWLDRLNRVADSLDLRNAVGQRIRFEVSSASMKSKANLPAYETGIFESGLVPTRIHGEAAWHDYFNALVWLAFPLTKAALNQRQARAIAMDGISAVRGPLRDALTLFDESAVLLVCSEFSFGEDLRQFNWTQLFVERRSEFVSQVRCVVFGHALLHKLVSPYKSVCGQALVIDQHALDQSSCCVANAAGPQKQKARLLTDVQLDREAACLIADSAFGKRALTPLPILGIPGWWAPNEQSEFYNDSHVFRRQQK